MTGGDSARPRNAFPKNDPRVSTKGPRGELETGRVRCGLCQGWNQLAGELDTGAHQLAGWTYHVGRGVVHRRCLSVARRRGIVDTPARVAMSRRSLRTRRAQRAGGLPPYDGPPVVRLAVSGRLGAVVGRARGSDHYVLVHWLEPDPAAADSELRALMRRALPELAERYELADPSAQSWHHLRELRPERNERRSARE